MSLRSAATGAPAKLVAGIDEAGRGPLAGPVVAAAVILDRRRPIGGLDDSKKLARERRETLAGEIRRTALAWSVAWSDAGEIDRVNILAATLLAMRRAILGLRVKPATVLIDGNRLPALDLFENCIEGHAIVGGDGRIPAISAASILAKVARDAMMQRADRVFPGYGFASHKGYGTAEHLRSLERMGPCQQHRQSFRPLKQEGPPRHGR